MAALKTLSDSIKPLAIRNMSMALRLMANTTQKEMAGLLGCAESSLSEWKEDQLERAMQIIAAAGGKVVARGDKLLPAAEIIAYKVLAKKAMEMEDTDFGAME